jgi:hypothetical protein
MNEVSISTVKDTNTKPEFIIMCKYTAFLFQEIYKNFVHFNVIKCQLTTENTIHIAYIYYGM